MTSLKIDKLQRICQVVKLKASSIILASYTVSHNQSNHSDEHMVQGSLTVEGVTKQVS